MAAATPRNPREVSATIEPDLSNRESSDSGCLEQKDSPTPSCSSSEKHRHRQPPKTLQIPSSKPSWPEAPHSRDHSHDHHRQSNHDRHDPRRSPGQSISSPLSAKTRQETPRRHSRASPHHRPRDPEKIGGEYSPDQAYSHRNPVSSHHTTILYRSEDCEDDWGPEEHSVWILVNRHYVPATNAQC